MVVGQHTSQKGGAVLTKTEAQKIRKMESALKDYQDEKLGVYGGQVGEMHVVFDKARQKREELKALYEKRHQTVLHELADMRQAIDANTQALHHRLKKFSLDFEDGVAQGKAEWRSQFGQDQDEIGRHNSNLDKTMTRLREALDEEREECRRSIQQKSDEIRLQISERSALLQIQIEQRKAGNEAFLDRFNEKFGELRQRLREEAEDRERRCSEERLKAKKRFAQLNEDQSRKDAEIRQRLQDEKNNLEYERKERTTSQGIIVSNMMNFMEQFEANIAENHRKQAESQKHLLELSEKNVVQDG